MGWITGDSNDEGLSPAAACLCAGATKSIGEVGERLIENMNEAGAGTLLAWFQIGDMPHDKAMYSMEQFSEKVRSARCSVPPVSRCCISVGEVSGPPRSRCSLWS